MVSLGCSRRGNERSADDRHQYAQTGLRGVESLLRYCLLQDRQDINILSEDSDSPWPLRFRHVYQFSSAEGLLALERLSCGYRFVLEKFSAMFGDREVEAISSDEILSFLNQSS
jgi:hypothetical protein